MGSSASDVLPFTQARANLCALADQAKARAEKIISKNGESDVALIHDAQRGLADTGAGRTSGADAAIARRQQQRAASASGKAANKRG